MTKNRILLPSGISPSHYSLSLSPNLTSFTSHGQVSINLTVSQPSEKIVLHTSSLTFKSVEVSQKESARQRIRLEDIKFDEEEETAEIPVTLSEGPASLSIEFQGEINDKMVAFYRATYKESDGSSQVVVCTQFEPNDARKAFPCWDEPLHKATFELDILAPEDFVVLSNTPVKDVKKMLVNGNAGKRVFFETTPKMSTYLMAWFMGKYAHKTLVTKKGVNVSIYTPAEKLAKAEWALSVAKQTLEFFEDYFGIDYPLTKLDMVAISDFVNGAMENWGLVTYRDTAIYCDDDSSAKAREWVTAVVSHELAHQWFGNLVTMEWWSELWLNEGFATFMQSLENAKNYPTWGIWETFVDEKLESALGLDSLRNSHPVEVEISHSREINEVFDAISYKKGASLLRMLYTYIGDEKFKLGVSSYLKHFAYDNSDSDGLWRFLSESSGKDVAGFMHLFTRKQGFPFVKVDLISRDGNTHSFRLEQERFLITGEKVAEEDQTVWKIPIRVDVSGQEEWIYMESKVMEVDFEADRLDYILFNSGATGFFRTLHSEELMQKLMKTSLPVSDRFMIFSDSKAFLIAGKLSAGDLLTLMQHYRNENNHIVWTSIMGGIDHLKRISYNSEAEQSFKRFAISLMSKIFKTLGTLFPAKEEVDVTKLRGEIISQMANCGNEQVNSFLKEKFEKYVSDGEEINANIFFAALKSAVENGGQTEFEAVKKVAETVSDPMRKNQALAALGASKSQLTLINALEYILADKVKKQDTFFVFNSVAQNPLGTVAAWSFFKTHYLYLRETYSHDSLFSRFVTVVGRLTTTELVEDAEAFFAKQKTAGYDKVLNQSIEVAKLAIQLRKRELSSVKKWLKEHGY